MVSQELFKKVQMLAKLVHYLNHVSFEAIVKVQSLCEYCYPVSCICIQIQHIRLRTWEDYHNYNSRIPKSTTLTTDKKKVFSNACMW